MALRLGAINQPLLSPAGCAVAAGARAPESVLDTVRASPNPTLRARWKDGRDVFMVGQGLMVPAGARPRRLHPTA